MNKFSKNRVLELYNILLEQTDEQHQITMKKILFYMESAGCSCSEDSILRYIKQLKDIGIDIVSTRGRNASYFIGNRMLEKEEIKLIIDAINASNFIEKTIAFKMINKLKSTMSIYDADALDKSILGINVAKAENKKILYNINKIQEAFTKNLQISFDYLSWNKNKKLIKKSVRKYTMNPWTLIWANDRYYLYGYDVKETDGKLIERNYRVDKLDNIELSDKLRNGRNQFENFNANTYVSRRMGMFSGHEQLITVRIAESLIGVFIDQFGSKIVVNEECEGVLLVIFTAVPSSILLGWLLGLKKAEVLEPQNVRNDMATLLEQNMKFYLKKN